MHPWGHLYIHHRSTRRLVMAAAGLALIAGVLPTVAGAVPGTTAVPARADDVTASQNLLRNGWDSSEPAMGPSVVPTFVQRFNASVDGAVYAQPLVVGSTVIVATENDQVYGLDAGTGAQLWHTSLGSPYPISTVSTFTKCTDLVPNIGVTGTPAYDPVTNDIYMFANIMTSGSPAYYMVQMDTSGNIIHETPITGHPSNNSNITFSAKYEMERPAVMILDGAVYGAFASHCDFKPYSGYVARVNLSTNSATLWSDESGVTYNQAGIWQSGGGIMSDGSGRVFVTSGNGVSPTAHAGTSPGGQLAESVIRLGVNTSGTLSAKDFFSPANAPSLDAADTDYGSGGPVGVQFPIGNFHALAQVGKDGRVWLLNTAGLGGRKQGSGGTDADLFVSKAYGGEWGHPAVFGDTSVTRANSGTTPTDNDFLFSVGKDDVMRVFRFYVSSSGKPGLTNLANSSLTYGFTSGSPVVTSSGDDPTSAVIWEVFTPNTTSKTGAGSQLEAYALGKVAASGGTPSSCVSTSPCTLQNIWSSPKFTSAKFSIPATSQGWVYVGTRDGHLLAFAAPAAPAPAQAATATFAQTAVSSTTSKPVSVTAKKTVTFTGVTASTGASNATAPANQFTVGQVSELKNGSSTPVPVTFPVTLSKGDKLTAQTTFAPAAPGGTTGALSFSTGSATFPTVDVPLTGEGTQDGLYPQPSAQTFPLAPDQGVVPVPVGIQRPEVVTISNFGTTTQTVTSITPPVAPFTATGLPVVGDTIKPGQTISVQLTFAPSSAGPATGSFTLAGSSGTPATITLSGVGAAADSQLTAADPVVNFGTIPVGKKATAHIQISNTGNTASTVKGTSAVPTPFAAPLKPQSGMPFNPDSDMAVPVTFTPTKKGTFSTHYQLTWTDVNGTHTLTVILTGTAV
jgi:outer membrane protein assembly factor BamB